MGGGRGGRRGSAAPEGGVPRDASGAMMAAKVKVEKPELDPVSARLRLDAVLEQLQQRGRGAPREPLEEEPGKAPGEAAEQGGLRPASREEAARAFPAAAAEEAPGGGGGAGDPPPETELVRDPPVRPQRGAGAVPGRDPPVPRVPRLDRPQPRPRRAPGAGAPQGRGCAGGCPPPAPPWPRASPPPSGLTRTPGPSDQVLDPAPSITSLIYKNMER
ncbi:protein lin-37 homolog isoform X1 [Corvus hawaiiensis]|uniref:protein lin-37 homolog isoform X1 n=1 Tax=Corvus hawaiiensis TaxID=134902 RepID=UPI002018CA25|nr:protein lin-37 homolog isoform X1 [Corvus hawaiiensis]